jgi:hypothetical protein
MANHTSVLDHTETETNRSTGAIVQDVIRDVQEIIRAEFRLAKAEMAEKAAQASRGGGLIGGAAMAGLLALACLVATCIAALSLVMPVWAAALTMTVLLAALGAGLFAAGKSRLKRVKPVPEQTVETLKEDVQWVKNRNR